MNNAPKLFEHIVEVYAIMDGAPTTELSGDGHTKIAYVRGVELILNLGLSNSYYSPIFNALKEMGCIEQLERGRSARPSVYRLIKQPDLAEFFEAQNRGVGVSGKGRYINESLHSTRKLANDIETEVNGLKQIVAFLASRQQETDRRLAALESQGTIPDGEPTSFETLMEGITSERT
jgi:hypothetical protein